MGAAVEKKDDQLLNIYVHGFEANNPKCMGRKNIYFRLNVGFLNDLKIKNLTSQDKIFYIALLCLCAEQGRSNIVASTEQLRRMYGARTDQVRRNYAAAQLAGLISITYETQDKIRQDKIRQDDGKNQLQENPATTFESFKSKLPQSAMSSWNTLYKDAEFVEREVLRCWTHYHKDGAARDPGRWVSLINTWLERGYRYNLRKSEKKRSPGDVTLEELDKMMEGYDPNDYK